MRLLIFGGGGIAEGIRSTWPYSTIMVPHSECDVRSTKEVRAIADSVGYDAVVNCAGVSSPRLPWLEVDTNLTGSIHVAMLTRGPLVLIASVAGLYGKPDHLGYSASKAGVISVAQSLAAEGRDCWAISPGRVDTQMRERDYPADTPGSRLHPEQIGVVVGDILLRRLYAPGTNVVVRKEGLDTVIVHEHRGDGWRERLRVGQPSTI